MNTELQHASERTTTRSPSNLGAHVKKPNPANQDTLPVESGAFHE